MELVEISAGYSSKSFISLCFGTNYGPAAYNNKLASAQTTRAEASLNPESFILNPKSAHPSNKPDDFPDYIDVRKIHRLHG
jgi:hypothetical protein